VTRVPAPTLDTALVATGGALGTLLRYGLDETLGVVGDVPVATLVVNLVGSLAIGVLIGRGLAERTRLLVCVGVLGGFTTYSAFAVQLHDLGSTADGALAFAYAAATVVVGFALAVAGLRWGQRRSAR
jgi:CrcB protein